MGQRLGFDVGGTFTDFVMVDTETGDVNTFKHPTTDDPSVGVLEGLSGFLEGTGTAWEEVDQLIHATTLATNTVLERDGADTALLVTEGFRDVPILGRQKRYDLYDLTLEKQDPVVPREHVYGIGERIHPRKGVVDEPDPDAIRDLAADLAADYDSVAISFLHSYRDDSHERRVASILEEEAPSLYTSISSDLSGLYREYERTNTAAVDAYVKPRMREYLGTIEDALADHLEAGTSFYLMKSSGGVTTPGIIREAPVGMIESGPVAGSLNSAGLGGTLGYEDVFSFDMGGTTAKICFIVDGEPHRTDVFEIDELEMKKGSGIPITLSVVDMIEISAGGGSVASVDDTGAISVGPESAGADPGPICYDAGGTRPTITDADLVLGYLNPDYFLGGEMELDTEGAADGIEEAVAGPLDVDVTTAAWGVKEVVDNSMMQASRIHASERGIDLRQFAMIAFGGAGPMHAAFIARELNVETVVVPTGAGVASAVGLLVADQEFHLDRTAISPLEPDALDRINGIFEDLAAEGRDLVARAGGDPSAVEIERAADMKYEGQAHELTVDLPDGEFDADDLARLRQGFHDTYAETYGYSDESESVEGVTWKVVVRNPIDRPPIHPADRPATASSDPYKGSRQAYFKRDDGFTETDVYDRQHLSPGTEFSGPAVVEAPNATTVVPPGDRVTVDEYGNLVVTIDT